MAAINSNQNSQNRATQAKVNEQMQADIKAQAKVTEQMQSDITEIAETVVNTDKTVNEINNKIDKTINNSNTTGSATTINDNINTAGSATPENITKDLPDKNSIFPFEDIKTLFNNYLDYFNSFDIHQQILIVNSLSSIFLLLLLFSYLTGLYANYLIDKFNLSIRFPRLAKLLYYRLQYQNYYFKYLLFITIYVLLLNLFFNLYLLFY